jgi:hypothetical protein
VWNDCVGVVARAGANYPSACFDLLDHLGIAHEGVRRSPAPHGRNMAFVYSADGSRSRRIPAEIMAAMPAEERDRFLETTLQPDAREKWLAFSPNADDTPEDWWSAAKGVHCAAIPMARQAAIVAAARSRAARGVWAQIDSPWQDKAAQGKDGAGRVRRHARSGGREGVRGRAVRAPTWTADLRALIR